MVEYLIDFLKFKEVKYKENQKLSRFSSVKIGGNARIIVCPESCEDTIEVLDFLQESKMKNKILGRMTNTLPQDSGYSNALIKSDKLNRIEVREGLVNCESGVSLPYLSCFLSDRGLSGFEELSGIPGSVGGAIYGNAGAFGRETADLIDNVTFYSFDDRTVHTAKSGDLEFGYRTSMFQKRHCFILSVTFNTVKGNSEKIKALISKYRKARCEKQPSEPSLGSVFKRPRSNCSASEMIDKCGLKGARIGDAEVSKKHAGFIINKRDAKSADFLALANYVSGCVFEKFGVMLEKEIEILTD